MIKYCLPIIKNSKKEVLKDLAIKGYDFYEVWLDYIEDIDEVFIQNLINKLKEKLILVLRRKNLEKEKISKVQSLEIISLLKNSQSKVDLDINGQKDQLNFIKAGNLNVNTIVSYHDYEETPDDSNLREIIDTMKIYNPGIFKVATKCNSPKDALRLLGLLLAMKEKGVKTIVLGMGELGVITRIFGTIWGNEMIFAPKNIAESSAFGQLTRKQLETIFTVLEK